MTAAELIERAGIGSLGITVTAFADALDDEPALLTGTTNSGASVLIRGYEAGSALGPGASATLSERVDLVVGALTPREQERLRGEALTPTGADAPVGQSAAASTADTLVPYAPPVQPLDTAESTNADVELDPRDVSEVEPSPCGNPDCVVIEGQELHAPGCPGGDA